MTPDRLRFLLEVKLRRRRREDRDAHYRAIARFLGVAPMTLRRWRSGETPIPRAVEIVMEIFYGWPEVTAEAVNRRIAERDAKAVDKSTPAA